MANNNTLPQARLVYGVPVLGPVGVAATLTTTWQQVLAFDAVRRGVIFANPGTDTIYVAPANLASQQIAGAIAIYPQEEVSLFGDPPISVNTAWMAWCATGPTAPFTIFNFTDASANAASNVNGVQPQSTLKYDVPIISPLSSGALLGMSSAPIIGANPVRRGIEFYNPGTVQAAVCPSNLAAIFGAGSLIVLPGGSKRIFAKGNVKVNCGFNAIAQTGSNNPLSVLEYV